MAEISVQHGNTAAESVEARLEIELTELVEAYGADAVLVAAMRRVLIGEVVKALDRRKDSK
ncbi:MAG: hypothetical protein ABSF28_07720 [Terracidiphilus sp.]|jgi:hypothetical protein